MADLFERPNKKSEEEKSTEEEKDRLLKTIGEQKVEIDFLKNAKIRINSDISRQKSFKSCKISQEISVSFEEQNHKIPESGLVCGFDLHKAA